MRTAVEANRKVWMGDEKEFVAHAAFYPVCKGFIPKVEHSSGLTGAPMIIFYGIEDVYGEGISVPELKRLLQKKFKFELITFEYPGATHGFNLNAPPVTYHDPAAKNGKG